MAADSDKTFVDVEVREGISRTEKIFRAFVTGIPDCPKNGLVNAPPPEGGGFILRLKSAIAAKAAAIPAQAG